VNDTLAKVPCRERPGTATLILCVCCVVWGLSFPLMPLVGDGIMANNARHAVSVNELGGSGVLNFWRYVAAAALTAVLACNRWSGLTRHEVYAGAVIGCCFAGGIICQTLGLRYIVPSLSGSITALSVVFAPIAQAVVFRQKVSAMIWITVVLAMLGMVVLAQRNPDATTVGTLAVVPPFPYAGHIITLIGSLFFTCQILCVDRLAGASDPLRMTTILFLTVMIISGMVAMSNGGAQALTTVIDAHLLTNVRWLAAAVALVVLCSVVTLVLMNTFQPAISAAVASVIYCLEPVCAAGFSVLLGQERLTTITVIGGGLVVAATLLLVLARQRISDRP